jgi:hypothetical protein
MEVASFYKSPSRGFGMGIYKRYNEQPDPQGYAQKILITLKKRYNLLYFSGDFLYLMLFNKKIF